MRVFVTFRPGETGMHVVGATLVGCAASMGGGTINNIIMGTTAGGVYWIRDVSYLLVAVCASVLTFYSWPYVELELARQEMNFNEILPNDSSTVTLLQFKVALEKNPAFEQRVRRAIAEELFDGSDLADAEPEDIFAWLDLDGTGELNRDELLVLARRQADESFLVFAVESVALGAFAVHIFAASTSKILCLECGMPDQCHAGLWCPVCRSQRPSPGRLHRRRCRHRVRRHLPGHPLST